MSNAPPTFGTNPAMHDGVDWTDSATLHHRDDGGGLLYELKAIRRASLAALVRYVMLLPKSERGNYVIEKPGDHRLEPAEIEALAARPDFPAKEDDPA